MLLPATFLALALAAPQPAYPAPPATEAEPGYLDCATPDSLAAKWTIIDARAMTSPAELAAALRSAPLGTRPVVQGGTFTGADMRAVAPLLANACLADTALDDTNWEGSEIPGLQLVRVSLTGAKAARVRWRGLSTVGVNFERVDFSGADLTDLRFVSRYRGASFADTSFRGANLTRASFACGITIDEWCIDATPDLTDANLTGADVSALGLWDARQHVGAALDNTTVSPRSLVNLGGARLVGPLRLATYFTPTYEDPELPPPVSVMVSAEEARTLINGTLEASAEVDRPSFDCAKATTSVELMICGEYEYVLRRLDLDLAEVWGMLRAAGKGDLAAQRRWLRSRAACKDRECLSDLYEARLAVLRGQLGPGITLAPGESVTYHSPLMPLPEAMRSGALYERIVPVLIDAGNQSVTLTGKPDGRIAAEGSAVGANAHTCDLGVEAARFDPATGWWSARAANGKPVPLFRIEGRRIHFRYSGNLGNTPEEASDFISCGARAGFSDGIDLAPQ